jgi:predicted outer membrane repeat protein
MNAKISVSNRLQKHYRQLAVGGVALLLVLPLGAQAGGVVTTCTEAALRAAVAGGGTVIFACDGTITLSNTIAISADTVLDGAGHEVTLSGGGLVRVLSGGAGVTLTLLSLSIADGKSTDGGGGVYSSGQLNATNCTFHDNSAIWNGGAIYNEGTVNVSCCSFMRNRAVGVTGAKGSSGTPFSRPGLGGDGGPGCGGAIYNGGSALIDGSLFATNLAVGGTGGEGGEGILGVGTYSDQTGGSGGEGGLGEGGALFNVNTANVVNCTFAGNIVSGGAGGRGGPAGLFTWNPHGTAQGFPGGNGGMGRDAYFTIYQTAGQFYRGPLYLGNCTVAFNSAVGGAGGAGGSGSYGNPNGQTGPSGSGGSAGIGSGWETSLSLVNTLLATNGGNGGGALIDLGHNLSSDTSCAFTNTGSMNNTDPHIGPLANNGGPTLTVALLAGSPAIDAADPAAAPESDQRGVARPVGPAPDIGAFEYGLPPALRISGSAEIGLDILVSAYPGLSCRLLAGSGLSNLLPIATNQIGSDGTLLFHDTCAPCGACRFYRVVMP